MALKVVMKNNRGFVEVFAYSYGCLDGPYCLHGQGEVRLTLFRLLDLSIGRLYDVSSHPTTLNTQQSRRENLQSGTGQRPSCSYQMKIAGIAELKPSVFLSGSPLVYVFISPIAILLLLLLFYIPFTSFHRLSLLYPLYFVTSERQKLCRVLLDTTVPNLRFAKQRFYLSYSSLFFNKGAQTCDYQTAYWRQNCS